MTSQSAAEFLATRRSHPVKRLTQPVPEGDALEALLTAAVRVPDHGKLAPWRFIVLGPKARRALHPLVEQRAQALGLEQEKIEKGIGQLSNDALAVVVVESPKPSETIPEIEQTYSTGAVCLGLVNAALAEGWGAVWLSGWISHDRGFVEEGLGLAPQERVAGIIHIGTKGPQPPERERPEVAAITEVRD